MRKFNFDIFGGEQEAEEITREQIGNMDLCLAGYDSTSNCKLYIGLNKFDGKYYYCNRGGKSHKEDLYSQSVELFLKINEK